MLTLLNARLLGVILNKACALDVDYFYRRRLQYWREERAPAA